MPYRHSRAVKWVNLDVPRSVFDQDILYSFGAIMTIRLRSNGAARCPYHCRVFHAGCWRGW
jgi:predicted Mrr-cat superfamily restriction endonuclease